MIPSGCQPGFYQVDTADPRDMYFEYRCPCGCGAYWDLPIYRPGTPKPFDCAWEWDGSETVPTLSPSIRHLNGCKFHGYMRAGQWTSAGDGAPVSPQVYRGGPLHPTRSDTVPDATPAPDAVEKSDPTVAPAGSVKTHHLKFVQGVLHQLHVLERVGLEVIETWLPIEGQEPKP